MSKTKTIVAILLILVAGTGAMFAGKLISIANVIGGTPAEWWRRFQDPRSEFPNRDRVNVLLIGKDYNRDSRGMPYTKGSRSDTLLMLSLDLENRKVSALSIPRDTYAEIPDTGEHAKINSAYARGGAPLTMQTVGNLLGVYPDYHIALKADAVKTIVDALGGVEVEAIDRMKYDDNWGQLHIDLPPGRQTINGEQAIGFTRFRKPNPGEPHSKEEGDERRMARQQQLLKAMMQKAKQPGNFLKADQLIETALGAIETDMTRHQIFALAALFRDVKLEEFTTGSVAGENDMIRRMSIFRPDTEKMQAQVDWLLRGDETAAFRLTVVSVKNGSGIRGLAREVAEKLRDQGFDAKSAGNAARGADGSQTKILYEKAAVEPRARFIANLLGARAECIAKQPVDSLDGADVAIVLGRDVAPNFEHQEAHL